MPSRRLPIDLSAVSYRLRRPLPHCLNTDSADGGGNCTSADDGGNERQSAHPRGTADTQLGAAIAPRSEASVRIARSHRRYTTSKREVCRPSGQGIPEGAFRSGCHRPSTTRAYS